MESSKEIYLPLINNGMTFKEDEKLLKSYNQEFYNTLNTLRQTRFPSIKTEESKSEYNAFYEFKSNENAAITSTAGQIYNTIEDSFKLNLEIKRETLEVRDSLKKIREEVDDIDELNEYNEYITMIRRNVQRFLVEQKTETFNLVKEIAILTKDKIELQSKIKVCLDKIKRLEEEVGIKPTLHSNSVDNFIKTHYTGENRFYDKSEIK